MSEAIYAIVAGCAAGQSPTAAQLQRLVDWEKREAHQADWQYAPENISEAISHRIALLQALFQSTAEQPLPLPGHWTHWIAPLWRFWLPLAQQLDHQSKPNANNTPFIQGILGSQGTGKTTLTRMLQRILNLLGHQTVALSIDDLYLTYAERQALQRQDPRLIWRGPPGTHDVALGLSVLSNLRKALPGTRVSLPQFDKSLFGGQGDRTSPKSVLTPTIILFEGWFVGAPTIADSKFTNQDAALPHPIITPADRQFALDSNRRLAAYLPLWQQLNSLIVLYPQDYRLSQQWRQQAEHDMKAQGKSGLSDAEIIDFVTYFWKALHPQLFITPLTYNPDTALVASIYADHSLGAIYAPTFGNSSVELVKASQKTYEA